MKKDDVLRHINIFAFLKPLVGWLTHTTSMKQSLDNLNIPILRGLFDVHCAAGNLSSFM
jgi:hypothetical protein